MELTPQGEAFISYAVNIMAQVERLENIGNESVEIPASLGISVSRASYCTQALSLWMNEEIRPEQPLSLHFCETNTEKVIDQVFRAESDLGVIRIPAFYESYYGQLLANKNLCHTLLMRFQMLLVMRRDHPLAGKADITPDLSLIHIFQEMDSYTSLFGIELIPCIQTLAHLCLLYTSIVTFFGGKSINFYNEPKYWTIILVILKVWKDLGMNMVIYLATITGFDEELYDAAAVDGASRWQMCRRITIPMLKMCIRDSLRYQA